MSRNVADARRGRFVFVIPIKRAGRTTMLSIKINEFQKIPSQNVNGRPLLRVCGGDLARTRFFPPSFAVFRT